MKFILGLSVLLISLTARSEVLFFVEYDVSVGIIKSMAEAFKEAKERSSDEMAILSIKRIFDDLSKPTPFTLVCPAFFPDKNLAGCDIRMVALKGRSGELSVRIKKPLSAASLGCSKKIRNIT